MATSLRRRASSSGVQKTRSRYDAPPLEDEAPPPDELAALGSGGIVGPDWSGRVEGFLLRENKRAVDGTGAGVGVGGGRAVVAGPGRLRAWVPRARCGLGRGRIRERGRGRERSEVRREGTAKGLPPRSFSFFSLPGPQRSLAAPSGPPEPHNRPAKTRASGPRQLPASGFSSRIRRGAEGAGHQLAVHRLGRSGVLR